MFEYVKFIRTNFIFILICDFFWDISQIRTFTFASRTKTTYPLHSPNAEFLNANNNTSFLRRQVFAKRYYLMNPSRQGAEGRVCAFSGLQLWTVGFAEQTHVKLDGNPAGRSASPSGSMVRLCRWKCCCGTFDIGFFYIQLCSIFS